VYIIKQQRRERRKEEKKRKTRVKSERKGKLCPVQPYREAPQVEASATSLSLVK
jgi:hypothetical protein